MVNYINQVEGKKFLEMSGDADFQKDLVRFFSGGRYRLSADEMKERGAEGLANDFVEHMRYQASNEVSALKDLQYVQDKENTDQRGLESFGRLMTAWDKSEGAGTGFIEGVADYGGATITSPSTAVTVLTGGFGIGSKLFAKAAGKATQLAIRQQIAELVKKGVAKESIQKTIKKTLSSEGIKAAARTGVVEGALGTGMAAAQGETREEVIEDFKYTNTDLVKDAAISTALGTTIGGAVGVYNQKVNNKVIDSLLSIELKGNNKRKAARKAAKETIDTNLKSKDKKIKKNARESADRSVQIAIDLIKRNRVDLFDKKKDAIPVDLVKEGDLIKKQILKSDSDRMLTTGLSMDTVRGITAATIDINNLKKLNRETNERITTAVARYISNASPAQFKTRFKDIETIRKNYGLSKEDMSLIYLSDLSEAGRILNQASQISKATANANKLDKVMVDVETLSQKNLSSFNDIRAKEIIDEAIQSKNGIPGTLLNMAKEVDAARIAFMTSQIGTTSANAVTSMGNTILDIADQFWKGFLTGEVVQRGWLGGVFSNLRGMTYSQDEARVLRQMMFTEQPIEYQNLFHDVQRVEVMTGSNSLLGRLSRKVNVVNTAVDGVFKQSMLYAGVDRRLRQKGSSFRKFIEEGKTLDELDPGLIKDAMEDANRFTFQQTYTGDKSMYGRGVRGLVKAHREVPFFVSGIMGIPFPRYIANHLEYINDYTPIGIFTGGLSGLDSALHKGVKYKTTQDRIARQMTGAALLMGGVYLASQKKGELDYGQIALESGGALETGRVAGPFAAHLLLGDLIYRWYNDMPIGNMGEDALEVAAGMGDLGFDVSLAKNVIDSMKQGKFNEAAEKQLGNIFSTFTYPATIARDIQGQINIESAASPYTKSITPGLEDNVDIVGERNFLGDILNSELLVNQSTRFLPDLDFIQISQTFNGKNDVPLYDGFNKRPVGGYNPLTRQMGFREDPELNGLEKELNVLKLEKYKLYNSSKIKNPTIDWSVRFRLSKTIADEFEGWRKKPLGGGEEMAAFAGRSYDELDFKMKKIALTAFVNQRIEERRKEVEESFVDLLNNSPKAALGYIRNEYIRKELEIEKQSGIDDIYNKATVLLNKRDDEGKLYKTAADYLGDSIDIVDPEEGEIKRRQDIMFAAEKYKEGKTSSIVPEVNVYD